MYPKQTMQDYIKQLRIEAYLEMKEKGIRLKKEEAEYLAKNHLVEKAKHKLLPVKVFKKKSQRDSKKALKRQRRRQNGK